MPKPIFTIGMPWGHMENMEPEAFNVMQNQLTAAMPDYYVMLHVTNADEMQFKVFYEKDFTDVQFEELKDIIKNEIKKNVVPS